jgi:photosystem II stability/assembly factor-like uncharacterized protein
MKKYTLVLSLIISVSYCVSLLFIISCDDGEETTKEIQWKKLGLDGKVINQLKASDETLYAATNAGLYRRGLSSDAADFTLMGFENKNVQALQILDSHEIIVSLVDRSGIEQPALHKTTNDGQSWTKIQSNFGGNVAEPLYDLAVHPGDKNILFGAGVGVVAKSADGGLHWEPVYGDWGGFASGVSVVTLNPKDPAEIWAGGQGAIENGFLLKSENGTYWQTWDDLVANPTVVKEITFSDTNNDQVLVGFEGALLKTNDSGQTWETLIDSEVHKFFFGARIRPGNPNRIYAAGWIKTSAPQPLVLHISNTAGHTWIEHTHAPEAFGGVWDMEMQSEEGRDRIFLGLNKGGVYEVVVRVD